MIKLREVHKYFADLHVLRGVNLDVNKGEVLSIVGASGSGKSTLLYCINALEGIDRGQIIVDGTDVHAKNTDINQLRQKLGMVFQQWNSFPHMTVLQNVALAPRIVRKLSRQEAKKIAAEHLEHVGLGDKLKNYPNSLSGGNNSDWRLRARWQWNRAICCSMKPHQLWILNWWERCLIRCDC